MPSISELNRSITIRHIAIAQNERGMAVKVLTTSQPTFAKVKKATGGYGMQQGQQNFSSTYNFTLRYEPNRQISNNDIIIYAGEKYTINDISIQEEGRYRWVVIKCTKDDHSGQISDTMEAKQEIHVTGDAIMGGIKYAHWPGSILCFRDGVQFTVVRNNNPQDKQINYDVETGLFNYPPDMLPGADVTTDIYLL